VHLTYLGHSCLLVETAGRRVLVDPGNVSTDWHGLRDLDAVLVTHAHPDHLDPAHVGALLAANPGAAVHAEPAVAAALADGTTTGSPVPAAALAAGVTAELGGGLTVEGVGGQHAVIHADIPRIGNVGMLLRAEGEPTFLHPGDAYSATPAGVDVLAVPLHAPWAAVKETVDFTRAVGATTVVPVHDRLLTPPGRAMYLARVRELGGSVVVDLAEAGRTEV
jgi:L-ascorbate metabolism protein UlaG (beta-lactamase superfamily)